MKKLIQILENVCAFLLCLLALSVLFQIIARFMRIPATWTTEVARSLFHIIVFMGMPIIIYENSQMAVTMVKDLFKHNRVVTLIFDIVSDIFIYFLLILYISPCNLNAFLLSCSNNLPVSLYSSLFQVW